MSTTPQKINNQEHAWEQWKKQPTKQNLYTAVSMLEKDIDGFANSFASSVNKGTVKSKAKLYAIEAVKTYDPSMGATLKTHFYNHIRPLAREAKGLTESMALSKHHETNANKYINFVRDFNGEYGREPDDTEISDALKLSPSQLKKMTSIVKYELPESSMDSFNFENKNQEHNSRVDMWTEYVYHDLAPEGKKIMDMKLGRNGHPIMGNIDIAKVLKISPQAVNRQTESIAKKIMEGVRAS